MKQTLYHDFEDGQQEALGVLSIASSEANVLARLEEIALSVGLLIIAQLLFLGGTLALLSRMLVVKPLSRISEQVSQRVAESWAQPLDLGRVEIAEIVTLQQGFNRLLRQVAESHALITATNADLEQRVAERTRNLDQRNRELVREHELTLALVRSIPGFVCVLDGAGAIRLANHAAGSLIGSPGAALVGQDWRFLPKLAAADHPLQSLFQQARQVGQATAQAGFDDQAGPERIYQFEALRVGNDADTRIIVVGVDITEQHEQAQHLHYLAFHDRLTGLPNRALLLDRLDQAVTTATRNDSNFVIAFIDLDEFKPINDSAGHEAGDAVLREIASRLRQCVRESDTVARHGGDEFVLLLPDGVRQGLSRIAEAVLQAVARPVLWGGAKLKVSASIGFAQFPQDGQGAKQLLDAADASMYRAKQAGRNRADFGGAQT